MNNLEDLTDNRRILIVNDRENISFGKFALVERIKAVYGVDAVIEFDKVLDAEEFLLKSTENFRAYVFCFDELQSPEVVDWWSFNTPQGVIKVVAFYNPHHVQIFEQFDMNHDDILVVNLYSDSLKKVDQKIRNVFGFPATDAIPPNIMCDIDTDQVLSDEFIEAPHVKE
jgi:hypothetical protein